MLTRALRERSTVGIILVTGRSDQIDRIVGRKWVLMIMSPSRWSYVNWWFGLKFALAYRSCPPGTAGDQR